MSSTHPPTGCDLLEDVIVQVLIEQALSVFFQVSRTERLTGQLTKTNV